MRKNAINYDGKILAVCETTMQLLPAGLAPAKVIFFIDSQAAILALSSNHQLTAVALFSIELKLRSSSHMAGLGPYSGSQVILRFPAMNEPTKKSSRESSRLNRKFS
ncbi:hypothetical protein TNCV_4036691 [Trichonephila clavipes]|nr:hypothetical protein TNCV_4036691 [Trichonephila clavipes]